jgi:hypothetical protein
LPRRGSCDSDAVTAAMDADRSWNPSLGPPMILGDAAKAELRLIVWCPGGAAIGASPILSRWPGMAPGPWVLVGLRRESAPAGADAC